MIRRLAIRSLTAHPVRSAILAAGFGLGVAVMALLLGVAGIILEQAQAPALAGGGDVVLRMRQQVPARLVLAGTLQSDAMRSRVRVAGPSDTTDLFLIGPEGRVTRVDARGGIPSLERALDDPEVAGIDAWRDAPGDVEWIERSPDSLLRSVDRFHPIPDAPEWERSWAEWLYFNGRSDEARFYLTFLVGPRLANGMRTAGVRLQLEHDGRLETYDATAEVTEADLQHAPDLTIGASSVRLDGMRYVVHLDLPGASGHRVRGDLTLEASPGRLVPPVEIAGARGWVTGYVVPVMSGPLSGGLTVSGADGRQNRISLDAGTGYHDHNWGFWEGVSWQWGQVQHDDVAFVYGRVFPLREAADPERLPGFLGALGPDGPIGYSTDVRITETNDARGRPQTITVRAIGTAFDVTLRFDVASAVETRTRHTSIGSGLDFLQMRGTYAVTGKAGDRSLDFTAAGAAETFRGTRGISRTRERPSISATTTRR
jgi:hypothetical protein